MKRKIRSLLKNVRCLRIVNITSHVPTQCNLMQSAKPNEGPQMVRALIKDGSIRLNHFSLTFVLKQFKSRTVKNLKSVILRVHDSNHILNRDECGDVIFWLLLKFQPLFI